MAPCNTRRRGLVPAALLTTVLGWSAAVPAAEQVQSASHTEAGLTATLEVRSTAGGAVRAGELATISLRFTTEDGTAARGLRPAAWAERAGLQALECRERVRGLIQARLNRRAEIDLNAWQLVYVGDNGALYVLDPVGGNARTRLLAVVNLGGRPGGIAEDQARDTIFVALPDQGEVVEIDTRRWAEHRRIAVGGRPGRLVVDPDGARLWVGQDGAEGATAEVAAVDRLTGEVSARLAVGPGPHGLTAAGPGRALAGGPEGAALLHASLATVAAQPLPQLGGGFTEILWSALPDLGLLLDRAEGRVVALRPDGRPVASWAVAPGAAGLFLDPTGRLLLVPEPSEQQVTVIDLGRGVVAHRIPLEAAPQRIGFSRTQAYVQFAATSRVALVALGSLVEGGTPSIASIAAGEAGLGPEPMLGASVITAPGDGAMLIASPEDRMVHVYMEGMAAPSGTLRTVQARPVAMTAIDRGLREVAPGHYETQAVFPVAGAFVLPVMQQGGGFLHCFPVEVEGDRSVPLTQRLHLELAGPANRMLPAGDAAVPLRVQLRGPAAEAGWLDAGDVVARLVQFAGHWQETLPMRALGGGLYEASVAPPRAGPVNLYVESASLGLRPGTLPMISLRAVAP